VTRPLDIMRSISGRNASIFSADDQRQVLRQPQDLGRVQVAGMTVAHGPAQHRGAGKMHLSRLEHERLVKRAMLELVVFADEDAQQHGVLGNLHGFRSNAWC
jgi:hypothetical protein